MKILMMGHAASPNHGSEPGIAWNWAWEMSMYHDIWLLAHPAYRTKVEQYLLDYPNPRLRIVWLNLDPSRDPWKQQKGPKGVRLHYMLWQRIAFEEAQRLHEEEQFDLVHHVSWNTISVPPRTWRLPVPFVWGPVGGGQVTPPAFYRYFGASRAKQMLRHARLGIAPYLPSLRATARHADLLLATNPETVRLLERAGGSNIRTMLDVGIPASTLPARPVSRRAGEELTVLWAGRFEHRKCLPLAFEAIARLPDLPIRLLVAGDGPLRDEWMAAADRLGVQDRVRFLGRLPWADMQAIYDDADLFMFTSLNDSSGTVVLEAMAHSLPILTLDHQGVGGFAPADAAVKVKVTTPEETIIELSRSLALLAGDPARRAGMGIAAWRYARTQTWDRKAAQMSRWYEELVNGVPASQLRTEMEFESAGESAWAHG